MVKKILGAIMAALFVLCSTLVQAGETDVLVQKLVEKGILTPFEAQIIKDETSLEVAKQNAQGKNNALPPWLQTMKLKGDVRARFEAKHKKGSVDRHRARIRYRLGIEAHPNAQWSIGAGLASGGSDPRSTNQTLENTFDTGDIRLDYAYAQYKDQGPWQAIVGKYNAKKMNYLWYTTDMQWDSDIMQEGVSVNAVLARVLNADVFANVGYWTLDESSGNSSDPGMYYGQVGMIWEPEPFKATLATVYYGFHGLSEQGARLDNSSSTNTVGGDGRYAYDYDSFGISGELKYAFEEGSPVQMAAIFGDYINNPGPSNEDTGYALGLKFGNKKIKTKGDWQLKYQYVRLERDAWLDVFPDSDRYSGKTNVKSHEYALAYGLAKNVSLGLDYYRSDALKGAKAKEDLFQADLVVKF